MRLRWKKHEPLRGLARIGAGPRGSDYTDGSQSYAKVYAHGRGPLWYWVCTLAGEYRNTCNEPGLSEQEAKDAAAAYVKARVQGKEKQE